MKSLASFAALVGLVLCATAASAQPKAPVTAFVGRPILKISEGGVERTPESIPASDARDLECVISKIGDDYFWASRRNVPLVEIDSGAFITYVAANGAGYIRVLKQSSKAVASEMSATEARFDYVEHALVGLRSITYYGTRQP
jgi:hypothetical protein